jgi:hypothetical protein
MNTARWNLSVSPETDRSVRLFLAAEGGGHKGDLSRFIENAVRDWLFEHAVQQSKAATAQLPAEEVEALIDEAVAWSRKP